MPFYAVDILLRPENYKETTLYGISAQQMYAWLLIFRLNFTQSYYEPMTFWKFVDMWTIFLQLKLSIDFINLVVLPFLFFLGLLI